MKRRKIYAYALIISMLISMLTVFNNNSIIANASGLNDKRACWISYIDINKSLKDKSEVEFRKKVSSMFDNVKINGMNTVIVHARAMGDSFYTSDIYPWSVYIDSNRDNPGYDPLGIMIEIAHQKGLMFEAWFNPYRLSNSNITTESYKNTAFYLKNKDVIIEYTAENGQKALSLDPAKDKTVTIITNGIMEVVNNYNIDGVHLDDYFYFENMADELSIVDKKANVNKLISKIYSTIKSTKPMVTFGISPAGNIDYARSLGADVDKWLSEKGYIDYIMPQIYWSDNYGSQSTNLYTQRINEWKSMDKIGIPMYVGLALYKVGTNDGVDKGWSLNDSNLMNQYKIAYDAGYNGFSLFSYAGLEESNKVKEINNLNSYLDILGDSLINNHPNSYISYTSHVQSYGWMGSKADGVLSGTEGQAKRLESIAISLGGKVTSGGVEYKTHVQSKGWLDWVSDGAISGTMGEAKRLEAICIKLTGDAANKYDVYYRVHAQSYGWLGWSKNGEIAGTTGLAKRLEAIQIVLLEKGSSAPKGNGQNSYIANSVEYNTHVQTYGWQQKVFDGNMSGTEGEAKRLEAITISQVNQSIDCGIRYKTHVQTYGWQDWVYDGKMSGTSGQAKRLEAIQIELTGADKDKYDIYYKVHVQTYGWQDWVKNGEISGTSGEAKRLEGIIIKVVPKGQRP